MANDESNETAQRDAAAARRQRILEGAGSRMDVVEGRSSSNTTTSTSSKLAAMRKRRFKKKTAEKSTEVESKESGTSSIPAAETEPVVAEETTTTATTTNDAPTTSENGDAGEKKKYMGVARMRRKMIKEKQQQQQDEEPSSNTSTRVQKRAAKMATATTTSSIPILMHVVTVLLLFFAGVDIGLQQVPAIGVQVHTEWAPRNEGGIHRILQFTSGGTSATKTLATDTTKPSLAEPIWQNAVDEDEFDQSAESRAGNNIDPVFQVDLDELTAGPGLLLMAARQAVKAHRFLLQIFFYGPISFFYWMLSFLKAPPVLCLVAIILRQLVGKTLLGAEIPSETDEENQKDIMSMAKNFVSNFLLSSFPTAVSLYDMWGHLRSDMYVIFCGLFVGLALSHGPETGSKTSSLAEEL